MTRRSIICGLLLAALAVQQAQGALTLTMTPSPADLSNLSVGQSVDITVSLSGLGGLELSSLGGTIVFPAAVFGTPTSSAAGGIVPDPADLTFDPLGPLAGTIDGQFAAVSGGNIVSEGVFFSFQIQANAIGSGVISFDPLTLFYQDAAGAPFFDIATNELAFTVRENADVVPEPATALLWLLLGSTGSTALLVRRRLKSIG